MLTVSPVTDEPGFLGQLNRNFPGWGGRRDFDWWFRRRVGGPPADLFVLRDEGTVLAGSAVSYRRLVLPGGRAVLAGVMTGSWTSPPVRRRGCFTHAIEQSRALCAARGAAWLLGFHREENLSTRALERVGAHYPTWYLTSVPETATPEEVGAVASASPTGLLERLRGARDAGAADRTRFDYPGQVLREQLVARTAPTEVLEVPGADALAVVEPGPDRDRLLALYGPHDGNAQRIALSALLARSRARGRELFLFTTRAPVRDAARDLALSVVPGRITTISVGDEEAAPTRWDCQDVDRA